MCLFILTACSESCENSQLHQINGRPVIWAEGMIPLVVVRSTFLDAHMINPIDDAVYYINKVFGMTLLLPPVSIEGLQKAYNQNVSILEMTYDSDIGVGRTEYYPWPDEGPVTASVIYLANTDKIFEDLINKNKIDQTLYQWYFTIMVHELGHVLGLGHDFNNACSIMYPSLLRNCKKDVSFEERDISKIRSLYFKE